MGEQDDRFDGPDRMLVWVRSLPANDGEPGSKHAEGPILWSTGVFTEERRATSDDIGDWEINQPAELGLLMFEGWIEVGYGPDPDVQFVGGWRRLEHWELCQLRFGNGLGGDQGGE